MSNKINFLPPWAETNLQPAFYDVESGTCLQQTSRMYAKVNQLVRSVNDQNETIANYVQQFIDLRDYVDDYFDNLDVQEEINKKLDEMAEDGSLTELIQGYVTPIFTEFTDSIDATVDSINTTVTNQNKIIANINNKVETATTGSPKGVYATASDLATADPDHRYIYVVEADNKWYYYSENDSTWVAGGLYLTAEGAVQYRDTDNLVDISTVSYGKILIRSGAEYDNDSYNITDYIKVEEGEKYTFFMPIKNFATFNSSKVLQTYYNGQQQTHYVFEAPYVFTVPTGISYIRASFFAFIKTPMIVAGEEDNFNYQRYSKKMVNGIDLSTELHNDISELIDKSIYSSQSINLIDEENIAPNCYVDSGGVVAPFENFKTAPMFDVEPETTYYTSNRIKCVCFYDQYYNAMLDYYTNNWYEIGEFTTPKGAYHAVFTYPSDATNIMVNKGNYAIAYQPYAKRINENIGLTAKMISQLPHYTGNKNNVLSGKKYVAIGDSFTKYTNATFDSGIYTGEMKTYPYLIGLRNNMEVVNMAYSGSTITNVAGSPWVFSDTAYTQVPADADYITIKYGINDGTFSAPLGTINDNTNTTFYGAWNKVLNYIITNHPLAKIGIIVTNGLIYNMQQDEGNKYAKATMDIAKKFGLPMLNEWNDPNVPLLTQTGRIDVSADIRAIRDTTFKVSSTNRHPNWQAQEYESTIVEDFIRSL